MILLNKIKFVLGLLFLSISIVGCYPILNDVFSNNVISTESTGEWMNSAHKPITQYNKSFLETYYPILVGCFALTGAF